MTTAETGIAPLVKSVTVPQDPPAAFRLFTEQVAQWWPLATFSVGESDATDLVFGRAVGDQIVETMRNGETSAWGTINVWSPPERVAFSWHPGTPEHEATTVEVTFVAFDDGTRVTLTHDGWPNRADGRAARGGYNSGWDVVLGRFTAIAGQ
jgi:hypothetical protein